MKTSIRVNMTGKEYTKYREGGRIKFSKNQKRGLPFLIGSFALLVVLGIYMSSGSFLSDPTPTTPVFNTWYNELLPMAIHDTSWHGIFKISFLYTMPWLAVAVFFGWIIHGVGFVVIKR